MAADIAVGQRLAGVDQGQVRLVQALQDEFGIGQWLCTPDVYEPNDEMATASPIAWPLWSFWPSR